MCTRYVSLLDRQRLCRIIDLCKVLLMTKSGSGTQFLAFWSDILSNWATGQDLNRVDEGSETHYSNCGNHPRLPRFRKHIYSLYKVNQLYYKPRSKELRDCVPLIVCWWRTAGSGAAQGHGLAHQPHSALWRRGDAQRHCKDTSNHKLRTKVVIYLHAAHCNNTQLTPYQAFIWSTIDFKSIQTMRAKRNLTASKL
jgi:hypothetical protein